MIIIYSSKCLEYEEAGHPESPERVGEGYEFLKSKNFKFVQPQPAKENDLLLVHTPRLIDEVENEKILDLDTPNIKGIYSYALLSAGGAINAMELALGGENSFSLMRPPGHHAGQDACGGFCYFNNIAVAVAKALLNSSFIRFNSGNIKEVKKVAILDIDCHHGNGTENIFLGKSNVLYISLHQSPLYPGTGLKSNFNVVNFPLPAGTEEKEYLRTLDIAIEKIVEFGPDLLAVSAGFDTYKNDPLTSFGLDIDTYKKIGEKIAALKLPTFIVLEGGYSSDLPVCLYNFLVGLTRY